VEVFGFDFGVARAGCWELVAEAGPVGGPGVGNAARPCMFCSGVCIEVACGLTPFVIIGPLGVGSAPVPGPGPAPGAVAAAPLGVAGYPFVAAMPLGADCAV
jgi:hypothetical protein